MKTKQALVTVGGIGSRLRKKGFEVPLSKAFIPLLKKPMLYWCLKSLESAGIKKIVIIGDTLGKINAAKKVIKFGKYSFTEILFYKDPGLGTSGLPYQAKNLLEKNFFFEYGHSISEREHYIKMDKIKKIGNIVISLFLPNIHSVRPSMKLERGKTKKIILPKFKKGEYFVGAPYLLDHSYIDMLPKCSFTSSKVIYKYSSQNKLRTIISKLPIEIDEFEEKEESLPILKNYINKIRHKI